MNEHPGSRAHQGRFIWYQLTTTDTKAAAAFYGHVLGWRTQTWADPSIDYTLFANAQGPVGGVVPSATEPPRWLSSVTVEDVDAAVTRVRSLGGTVLTEASDIPTVGRVAVVADPTGGTIRIFKPAPRDPMAPRDRLGHGEFTWHELMTSDHEKAFRFYAALFGWEKIRDNEMGAMGRYLVYGFGDEELGGMFTAPKGTPMGPTWFYYVHVDDLASALDRAKSGGARVMAGPMEVPGGARIAQLIDPQGAVFALHESTKKAG